MLLLVVEIGILLQAPSRGEVVIGGRKKTTMQAPGAKVVDLCQENFREHGDASGACSSVRECFAALKLCVQ